MRAVVGASAQWSTEAHLLAAVLDATRAGNWQRSGGKGKRPKPIPRPGVDDGKKTFGRSHRHHTPADMDRIMQRWGEPRPGRESRTEIVT